MAELSNSARGKEEELSKASLMQKRIKVLRKIVKEMNGECKGCKEREQFADAIVSLVLDKTVKIPKGIVSGSNDADLNENDHDTESAAKAKPKAGAGQRGGHSNSNDDNLNDMDDACANTETGHTLSGSSSSMGSGGRVGGGNVKGSESAAMLPSGFPLFQYVGGEKQHSH